MSYTDVFHYADRNDPVELTADIAIVDIAKIDQVTHPASIARRRDAANCSVETLMAVNRHAAILCEIDGERPQPESISATCMPGSS